MSFETGWCDDCCMPIGLGPCSACAAYSAVVAQEDYPEEEEDDDDIGPPWDWPDESE